MRDGPGCGGAGGGITRKFQSFQPFKTFQSFRNKEKHMASTDESFKDFVLDQLQELDDVEARRMFGGYGLYQDETFFGILHKGKLYFKVDESTIREYRKRKMKPFRPNAKQTLKSYYEVPVEIIDDDHRLGALAEAAIYCQRKKD
jgi:DNA transformation protein and related proteins